MARNTSTETQIKNIVTPVIQAIFKSGKAIYIIIIAVVFYFGYQYFTQKKEDNVTFNSDLIEKEIKNVGKLIVTEGKFSEVVTYKDQQKYLMDLVSFEKKALIVANANVTIAYDLRQIKYNIDQEKKTITITYVPEPELKINQELQFYDINQSRFNPFGAEDYNKINQKVKEVITKKVEQSTLKSNAENRLLSELSKLLILTNTMGWTLEYNGNIIQKDSDFIKGLTP
ncbi:hypothetical protein DI487_10515 [Flavobacterium sediminis]|uniref:DUF4230 domain-containing protein n=1 Tax=Flavobacterium sediminis TaxID=2201181 RepID=A0A2U8QVT9_9FLAO|nr:DUF4230 domain-containing protein [Flavobacterium sediminis]AWM14243.1 hypothetical protein DI487_10515 [Flavobacterium sediminis]